MMTSDLGVWTAGDCALVLIDYQNEMFEVIRSETSTDLVELHVRLLAKTAKAFGLPIVLSTVGVGFGFNGPTLPSVLAELDGIEPIDRTSMNAFEDPAFRAANLALFLIAGAPIGAGAGAGAVFKGTTGVVLQASAPENRVAMTSDLLIALFLGLSVPVIGAGIALNAGATAPDTVLVFAIVVGLAISVSGWALLGHRSGAARVQA
jgi:hypothetical protein